MDWRYNLTPGSVRHVRKYPVSETMATPGVPVIAPALANVYGVVLAATTTGANCLGVITEGATLQTAQNADGSDPQAVVSATINPDAIYGALLSGGATNGTLLPLFDETAGDPTGLLLTAGIGTVYDDGYAWGFDGANAGHLRKITAATGGDTAVPIVAFPRDIAIGDNFLIATFGPAEQSGFTLTTSLDQIDATLDGQGNTHFKCIELENRDLGGEGRQNSFALIVVGDHFFAN